MGIGSGGRGRLRFGAAVLIAAWSLASAGASAPAKPAPPSPPAPAKPAAAKPSSPASSWWGGFMPGRIGVLEVDGAIQDPRWIIEQIHWLDKHPLVRAMVLHIDSPGGEVGAVQEIAEELKKFREHGRIRRPIVASFAGVAASGGYYIAAPADLIISNPGTLTGSIGVILEFPVGEELLKKIGIEYVVIKSGRYKDSGNFARKMTPEEREIMQETVEDVYEQFLDEVWEGRGRQLREAVARETGKDVRKVRDGEGKAWLRGLADGRVLSGRLAYDDGLVDELGGYQDALDRAAMLAGMRGHPSIVTPPRPRRQRTWMDYLGGMLGLPEPSGSAGVASNAALKYLLR